MTPQELDVALKDIRRTRNFMIFFGFIPMIYLFVMFGVVLNFPNNIDIVNIVSLTLLTLLIDSFIIIGICKINNYLTSKAKIKLVIYSIGLLGFVLMPLLISILEYCIINSLNDTFGHSPDKSTTLSPTWILRVPNTFIIIV